jgi:glycosyltransferase involved in cell wall biosynthesis
MSDRRPRILLLAMYDMAAARSGPEVRVRHLLSALREVAEVDVVAAGRRSARRLALARYAIGGRLRGLDGIYVESSTALPSETDIAVLGVARAAGIPVLTYIRDAYQLFPDYYAADTLRRRASRLLFPAAIRALRAASTRLAFPSRGLAEAVLGTGAGDAVLLPPGAPPPVDVPQDPGARDLLFVGDTRVAAQGGRLMLDAIEIARGRGADVGLLCVARPGGEPAEPHPAWLRVARASSDEIAGLLPSVVASVIPRAPGAYNDLALPIKLMEYLAYGRPLLVTDRTETAAVVRDAGAGLVCGDTPDAMADAIVELVAAGPARRAEWATAARRAAERHAWSHRAADVLAALKAR